MYNLYGMYGTDVLSVFSMYIVHCINYRYIYRSFIRSAGDF